MYKPDLVLKNLQWLICRKTKPNQTKPILSFSPSFFLSVFLSFFLSTVQ